MKRMPPSLHPAVKMTGSDKYILDWFNLKDTSATLSYSVDFGKLQLDFNKLICGSWVQLWEKLLNRETS